MQSVNTLLLLDEIQDHLREITEISKRQQQTLASGVIADLADMFERRSELFTRFINKLRLVHEYLNENEEVRTLESVNQKVMHLNKTIADVVVNDEKLQNLLSLRSERIQIHLSEKYWLKNGIRHYRDVEADTGVVSRIFQGHSRYFDDKR